MTDKFDMQFVRQLCEQMIADEPQHDLEGTITRNSYLLMMRCPGWVKLRFLGAVMVTAIQNLIKTQEPVGFTGIAVVTYRGKDYNPRAEVLFTWSNYLESPILLWAGSSEDLPNHIVSGE